MKSKKEFKIVFMGTPEFAAESLQNLVKHEFNIAAVVTSPDKPAGRGQKLSESAVKQTAESLNLKILQPQNLKNPKFINELQNLKADLFVVVAFRMLPEPVWAMPPLGTINLHASLLPDYRGAAPINRVLMNGEKKTGLTTFFIEKEIDTGKIIDFIETEIETEENAGELHDRMMRIGADLLVKTCESILKNDYKAISQNEILKSSTTAKSAPKIFKEDCKINWNREISEVYNFIRGLSPHPSAFTDFINSGNGKQLNIKILKAAKIIESHNYLPGTMISDGKKYLKIACINGFIEILELTPAGKKKMKISEFLNGIKIADFKIN
jgi:methionyl-tRNA formyltransferase